MQALARLCVRRPVFASVLILALVVVGWVGYTRLGVDRFPNVDFPIVTVVTRLPGAAPEEVETEITDKIEDAVNTISGIDELRSISVEGVSPGHRHVRPREGRRRRRAGGPRQGQRASSPICRATSTSRSSTKLDPDATPVLSARALGQRRTPRETTEFADKVMRRQIESITGVGQVHDRRRAHAPDQRPPRSREAP